MAYLIEDLRAELKKVEEAIVKLEALHREAGDGTASPRPRRGRKSMGALERQEVSVRMKKYWARRLGRVNGAAN